MPNVNEILAKTLKATKAGKLQWELVGRDSFRTQIGKMFLTILSDDGQFIFTIYDDDGNQLDNSSGYHDDSEQVLYEAARRTALRVDDALDNLDRQLDELL
jgi:hypothetical protein